MSFTDDMKEHDQHWTETQEQAQEYAVLPDGDYQALIKIARVEKKDWGWEWALMFNDTGGKGSVWSNMNLDDEMGREIAAKNAKRLGYEGSLSGLEEACGSGLFDDLLVEITVRTKAGEKRDFTNTYIQRNLGKQEPGEAFAEAFEDESSVPF
jgi:hypothetical protein